MAQANAATAGATAAVPQVDGVAVADEAVPLVNGVVLAHVNGTGVRAAGQAAAPAAGPPVAPVAGALFPPGLAPARFDVDGALRGPLPTRSKGSYEILPKIAEGTGP